MADNTNNQQSSEPGLIGSHAQYVKGAAEVRFPNSFIDTTYIYTNKHPGYHRRRHRLSRMDILGRTRQSCRSGRYEKGRRAERSQSGIWQGRRGGGEAHGL